jgi:hypothetical protein
LLLATLRGAKLLNLTNLQKFTHIYVPGEKARRVLTAAIAAAILVAATAAVGRIVTGG